MAFILSSPCIALQPKKFSTAYGSTQPLNIGSVKQQKPSSKLGNKTVYGPLETSTTGPGSVNSPIIDSKHDPEFGALKQKKPSCKLGKKSTCADNGTSARGFRSGSVSSAARTSSQWVYKKNSRTMLQPLDKNSQELPESQNPNDKGKFWERLTWQHQYSASCSELN
ncbi:unnamed protein product [Coffea canephora]|uniref:Uncharacterized protein n=1 Tax=Coffea canephora TaxID=49390 RepID=A0A068TPU6_COFCA|nr:unnamed protein product [Coffea canephora]